MKKRGEPIFNEEAWFYPEFGQANMQYYKFKDAYFPPVQLTRIEEISGEDYYL